MIEKALRARVVLAELEALGLTLDDLLAVAGREVTVQTTGPTVADYVTLVAAGYKPRSQRTYNSYWTLLVELLGEVALERVTVDDLITVVQEAVRRAQSRRTGSDGRASHESCVAATRAVFARAHKAGLIPTNLALLVDKPRRLPNRRRALNQAELNDLWAAVSATTRDPELDLLRFHLESGARRMGAIRLRLRDLDGVRQTIWLREKFGADASSRSAAPFSTRSPVSPRPVGRTIPTTRCSTRSRELDAGRLPSVTAHPFHRGDGCMAEYRRPGVRWSPAQGDLPQPDVRDGPSVLARTADLHRQL